MGRNKKVVEQPTVEVKEVKEERKFKCCLCGNISYGYGNDPYPIKNVGRCCDQCNKIVVLRRLSSLNNPNQD